MAASPALLAFLAFLAVGGAGCGSDGAGGRCVVDPPPAEVFSAEGIHRIDFTLSAEDRTAIDADDRPKVHAAMTFDGVAYPDVGLRLKGAGSYEPIDGKPSFNVDLNEWVPGTRLHGLKAFRLHSDKSRDPTRTHEWLSFALARAAGLLAPRVGFAEVSVDGRSYGIYVLVEKHDDVMIGARDPAQKALGVLFEPAGFFIDFGLGMLPESGGEDVLIQARDESPEPPDPAVLQALLKLDAALAAPPTEESLAVVWELVDRDRFLDYMAWEAISRHEDGYRGGANWRLFVDGTSLKAEWVASGADSTWYHRMPDGSMAMGRGTFYEGAPGSKGVALTFCMQVPSCRREYAKRVLAMADLAESLDLAGEFEALSKRLDGCIASDPKPLFDADEVDAARWSARSALIEGIEAIRADVRVAYPDL